MGYEVLTAENMKIKVFWDVTPCTLIESYQRFGGICCRFWSWRQQESPKHCHLSTILRDVISQTSVIFTHFLKQIFWILHTSLRLSLLSVAINYTYVADSSNERTDDKVHEDINYTSSLNIRHLEKEMFQIISAGPWFLRILRILIYILIRGSYWIYPGGHLSRYRDLSKCWMTNESGFDFREDQENFFLFTESRPAPRTTQPHILHVLRALGATIVQSV
jgi:hypothetical protein